MVQFELVQLVVKSRERLVKGLADFLLALRDMIWIRENILGQVTEFQLVISQLQGSKDILNADSANWPGQLVAPVFAGGSDDQAAFFQFHQDLL